MGWEQLLRKIGEDIRTIVSWRSRAIPTCEHGEENWVGLESGLAEDRTSADK